MTYPDVVAGTQDGRHLSGFDHYLRHGYRSRAPHWLFNEGYYRTQHTDLTDEMLEATHVANG